MAKEKWYPPNAGVYSESFSKPVTEKIERECLKCLEKFMANGKYIRICDQCKKQAEHSEW